MDTKWLLHKGNTWYARVAIPRSVWAHYSGKRHILKSLKTGDLKTAQRRRHKAVAIIKQGLEAEQQKVQHEQHLAEHGVQTPADLIAVTRRMVEEHNVTMGDYTDWLWDLLWSRFGLEEDGSPVLPADWAPAVSIGDSMVRGVPVQLASAALKDYLAGHPHLRPSTLANKEKRIRGFLLWLGGDVELSELGRPHAIQYIEEVIKHRRKADGSAYSQTTMKDECTVLSSFFEWCQGTARIEGNLFDGLAGTLIKDTTRGVRQQAGGVRPWSKPELAKLFRALKANPGTKATDKVMLPVAAICAYSGMRLNELCEMRLEDITQTHFSIREAKNKNSLRHIPIHKVIKPMVRQLVESATDDYLIPGLKPGGQDGKRGHYFSKDFGRFIRKHVTDDTAVNFHSLRRSFCTAMENAGIPESTAKQIAGHAKQSETYGRYSSGLRGDPLRKAVESVDYGKAVSKLL